MDTKGLGYLGLSKLQNMSPRVWDTDAYESYLVAAQKAFGDGSVDADAIELGWREAMASAKVSIPKQFDEYLEARGEQIVKDAVPWDKVLFKSGRTDGDMFFLTMEVEGRLCTLECTDVQLDDPSYVVRKLRYHARRPIECPYLAKRMRQNWFPAVIVPWLESNDMQHAHHVTTAETVEEAIYGYCHETASTTSLINPWDQTKMAVREGDYVYIPFTGVAEYVRKATGKEVSQKSITAVLMGMGGVRKCKGANRRHFYSIPYDNVYDETGEARSGQDDGDREGGEGDIESGWDRAASYLRQEEPDGPREPAGVALEGETGPPPSVDDPRGVLPTYEGEPRDKPNEIPF